MDGPVTVTDPSAGVAVRPATAADLPAAVDLLARVAAEGRWLGTEDVDRTQRLARYRSSLASPDHAAFVADASGLIVGHLTVELRPYGVAEVGMLVAATWRRQGVGTRLLGAGVDWARGAGAHKVALQVWPHNDAALALYRRFGFVEEGLLRRHYRRHSGECWDAVVMGLLLDEDPSRG